MPAASPTTPSPATCSPTRPSDNEDFYEPLRATFTYDGEQYCAPKDFSTLALQINTASWEAAGLTDDDIPTTYEELATVAEALTTDDQVGLGIGVGIDRLGAFVVGSGGWWLNEDSTAPTANTPEVLAGLQYVQDNLEAGNFALSSSARRRLGRRGVRHRASGDGHRRQLDQGRDVERLPRRGVRDGRDARGAGRAGHAAVHAVLGRRRRVRQPGPGGRPRQLPHRRPSSSSCSPRRSA